MRSTCENFSNQPLIYSILNLKSFSVEHYNNDAMSNKYTFSRRRPLLRVSLCDLCRLGEIRSFWNPKLNVYKTPTVCRSADNLFIGGEHLFYLLHLFAQIVVYFTKSFFELTTNDKDGHSRPVCDFNIKEV